MCNVLFGSDQLDRGTDSMDHILGNVNIIALIVAAVLYSMLTFFVWRKYVTEGVAYYWIMRGQKYMWLRRAAVTFSGGFLSGAIGIAIFVIVVL